MLTCFEKGKGAKFVSTETVQSTHWFDNKFVPKTTIERYPLSILREAFHRSETLLTQASVDSKRVERIAKDVFLNTGLLLDLPKVALVDGVLYGVGGRHRINAINETVNALNAAGIDQVIPCVVVTLDMPHLLKSIEADNDARDMSPVEKGSLAAQSLGYKPEDTALPDVKTPAQLFHIYRQYLLDTLNEPINVQWKVNSIAGVIPLSAGAKLTLVTALVKFILTRETPRPKPLSVSAEVLRELGEDVDEDTAKQHFIQARDAAYPVPPKVTCHLGMDDMVDLTGDVVQFINEYFSGVVVESTLVAREIAKTPFLYDFVSRFSSRRVKWSDVDSTEHETSMLEYLNELNNQRAEERAQAKSSKRSGGKKRLDGQAIFDQLDLLDTVQSIDAATKEKMMAELREKLASQYDTPQ